MGLFNFLKKKEIGEKDATLPVKEEKKGYYGDLEKTAILTHLFEVAKENRDEAWNNDFLSHVAEASFACGNPQVIQGPDGFPYFQLETPESNKPFQCYVISHMIPDFILERGIGIVVNAHKGDPDWVFSYGSLVNFAIRNQFYTPAVNLQLPKEETLQQDEQVLIGKPSEEFLPQTVRHILRQFIEQQGIRDVKIALMSRKYDDLVLLELVTNLTPHKTGEQLYEALQTHLKWFLPNHYSVIAMDEDSSLKDDFEPL
ncbi:MAG: hypothetical protein EAS52_18310 [Parapedobacter sp.]|nr:MAG: hypothetical protein EAS52_18310 [Parapedobacter sp.]